MAIEHQKCTWSKLKCATSVKGRPDFRALEQNVECKMSQLLYPSSQLHWLHVEIIFWIYWKINIINIVKINFTSFFFLVLFKKAFLMFYLYLRERERETECEQARGRERWKQNRSRLQALSCQHRAWCGARTHKRWDHDLRWSRTLNWLSHPGAPVLFPFLMCLLENLKLYTWLMLHVYYIIYCIKIF